MCPLRCGPRTGSATTSRPPRGSSARGALTAPRTLGRPTLRCSHLSLSLSPSLSLSLSLLSLSLAFSRPLSRSLYRSLFRSLARSLSLSLSRSLSLSLSLVDARVPLERAVIDALKFARGARAHSSCMPFEPPLRERTCRPKRAARLSRPFSLYAKTSLTFFYACRGVRDERHLRPPSAESHRFPAARRGIEDVVSR